MVALSKEDVCKGPANRIVPGACAILASKKVLDLLIHFAKKSRSGKCHFNVIMER